ncbi:MAG TPA: 4-hydroxybenzoate 3-monooxygenase [Bryobacteraceae bacterium]|nr:4-hydroxybenzoate 3-monooxygenase [Bryobacteraceae bacterium]
MRTQVGIVGAGPAGLLLSHLLHLEGIESIVIERHTREYVESRVRAGVLEQGPVDLLNAVGLGARMRREGLPHEGIGIHFGGLIRRVNFRELTGRAITVYGQQEVIKDLIHARLEAGGRILFEAEAASLAGLDSAAPTIRFQINGQFEEIACDFVGGCDGFHGISRAAIPESILTIYERIYPFGWLGILAETPPPSSELIYANHANGFALASMRSPTLSRLYLQCAADEDLAQWPDERIWEELRRRLSAGGPVEIREGPVLQKGVTPMRSFVAFPMQYGSLFLAGDAAHIVPPTGAKGMNLAIADVHLLARALVRFYKTGARDQLEAYSQACSWRVWRAQHFSWWMTSMLHRFEGEFAAFDHQRQLAELEYVTGSPFAARALAENYSGFPLERQSSSAAQ